MSAPTPKEALSLHPDSLTDSKAEFHFPMLTAGRRIDDTARNCTPHLGSPSDRFGRLGLAEDLRIRFFG
jgi:hypothetical protein